MAKKCIYCKSEIDQNSVIDFCQRCGIGVWGEKMFKAIVDSMENARDNGNLFQGSITDGMNAPSQKDRTGGIPSFNNKNSFESS